MCITSNAFADHQVAFSSIKFQMTQNLINQKDITCSSSYQKASEYSVVVDLNKLWGFILSNYNNSTFEFWRLPLNINKRRWNSTNIGDILKKLVRD